MSSLNYTNPATGSAVAVTVLSDATNAQVMRLDIGTGTAISAFTGAVTVTSGNVAVTGTVAATQSGTWNIGTVASITATVGTNLAQVAGVTAATGGGNATTGTQRVAVASATPTITDRSGSITTGGTAQNAAAAKADRVAFSIQNTHATATLRVAATTTASATVGVLLNPGIGWSYDSSQMPVTAISVWSGTTGATWWAIES